LTGKDVPLVRLDNTADLMDWIEGMFPLTMEGHVHVDCRNNALYRSIKKTVDTFFDIKHKGYSLSRESLSEEAILKLVEKGLANTGRDSAVILSKAVQSWMVRFFANASEGGEHGRQSLGFRLQLDWS
jgi:hypothetical protein